MKHLLILLTLISFNAIGQGNNGGGNGNGNNPCDKDKNRPKWCDEPLPITLKSFVGIPVTEGTLLKWEAEEYNHLEYRIERSYNGTVFTVIGNTTKNKFLDNTVRQSAYYRLVDVAIDGSTTTHRMIYVKCISKYFIIHDFNGNYLGTVKELINVPKNIPFIINNQKTIVQSF